MAKVTTIPATKNKFTALPLSALEKRRVAAYARVSTESEEQQTSYDAQVDHYTRYIRSREDWEFVKVYTDEGISALNTKKRDGFKEMVEDALGGNIDLIVTKSVSRFARNTVDSLSTVRKLKDAGVEVYFEKENIYTFDGKGELLITIMSSLAQEESRSISENVTWGKRKQFADGKFSVAYSHFLGYEKGEDGTMKVVPEEAETVRLIYKLFLSGRTPLGIAKELDRLHIPTPSGKVGWQSSTVTSILQNEKYKGDALLQKTYMADFLEKKTKVNNGEVQQYYVEGSHEAIIQPEDWERAQAEMRMRKELGKSYSGNNIFGSRIICEDCGSFFGKKVWHSTDKYRREIWRCNGKFKGEKKCATPHFTDDAIKGLFLKAYSQLMGTRKAAIEDCELLYDMIMNTTTLEEELVKLEEEIEVVAGLVTAHIKENAAKAQDQTEYQKKYDRLVSRYQRAQKMHETISGEIAEQKLKGSKIRMFIDALKASPEVLDTWDDELWIELIEYGTVHADGSITFTFKGGKEIRVEQD